MIFGKLFGSREQDDEPTATAPKPVRRVVPAPRAASGAATGASGSTPPEPAEKLAVEGSAASPAAKNESRGFDPYNSGVFNKSRAWERINRR